MSSQLQEEPRRRPADGLAPGAVDVDRELYELRIEVERMRLELTALKNFMKVANSSFGEQFPLLLEQALHDGDSESN